MGTVLQKDKCPRAWRGLILTRQVNFLKEERILMPMVRRCQADMARTASDPAQPLLYSTIQV